MCIFLVAIGLLLSWVNPSHFPPWVSWHSEVLTFASLLLGAGCLLVNRRRQRSRTIQLPFAAWPLILLVFVVAVQTQLGLIAFGGDAFVFISYFMLAITSSAIGFYCGGQSISDGLEGRSQDWRLSQFAGLVLLGGVFSAIVSSAQTLDVWDSANWIARMPGLRRPGGNLGQPNQLATLLIFSIASLLYLLESGRLSVIAALPIAALLLTGLSITESRSGALSLLLLAVWWAAKRRSLGFTLTKRTVVLWLVFFACCFWFWPTCFNFIQDGGWTDSVGAHVNTSAGTRLMVWPQLWEAVLQHPWFGWGLGGVSTAHNAVLHAYSVSESFTYAHNVVLDLAIGVGLPLTLVLLAASAAWLWRRIGAVNEIVSWYCLALALPFGVHSMLEFPFAYAYLLVPVLFLFGVLEARQTPARAIHIPWAAATVGWALVTAAMAWSVVEYVAIEEDFRVVRFESMRIGHTPSEYERPHTYILTQLDALLEGARIVPAPAMSTERIELARKVALRFPWAATQNRYALSLALNGKPYEAIRQLKVMRAMHGEKAYEGIKANWKDLAENKYPQLGALVLP
jgi:O-antigen ligase